MFGAQPEMDVGDNETIYAALRHDERRRPIQAIIRKTYFSGVDLIPGNIEVMEYEHEVPRVLANGNAKGGLFFERLRLAISEADDDYDIVVLDTPPSLGFLTLGAIYAATGMVVTIHPAMLDVASMSQFLLMMSDLIGVIQEAGATLRQDFSIISSRATILRPAANPDSVNAAAPLRGRSPDADGDRKHCGGSGRLGQA